MGFVAVAEKLDDAVARREPPPRPVSEIVAQQPDKLPRRLQGSGVALARHPVHRRQGFGRVEIVGEGREHPRGVAAPRALSFGQGTPFPQRRLGLLALLLRPVHRLAVMRSEHHEPYHLSRHALVQQVPHGEEVAERLRHLLALDLEHLVVQPHLRHALGAVGAAALRALVLVVGKHQVAAAAVDVEGLAQKRLRHGRALDVPAGAAPAPGRGPAGLVGGGGLPEDEIHRVALVGGDLDAGARDHVVDGATRKLAVVLLPAVDREEHMALGLVGMAPCDQRFDHRHHLGDELRRARHVRGVERAEGGHVLEIPAHGLFGDLVDGAARLGGAGDDLVVDIGEVPNVSHRILAVNLAQEPKKHVEDHDRAGVAEMGAVVDRGAADIDPHIGGFERFEALLLPGGGVFQGDVHYVLTGVSPRGWLSCS